MPKPNYKFIAAKSPVCHVVTIEAIFSSYLDADDHDSLNEALETLRRTGAAEITANQVAEGDDDDNYAILAKRSIAI